MARTNNTERKSTVKGVWIDMQTQAFNEYEIETEYTRSLDKAVKLANAIINPGNNPMIVVTVKEIVNEKAARRYYDNALLYAEARDMCMGQTEAEASVQEGEIIVKGTLYNFETQVFAYNLATQSYITRPFHWSCGNNVTARDARAMLAMRYEEMNPDERVICVHDWSTTKGYSKAQDDVWFVIDKEKARECMKEANES